LYFRCSIKIATKIVITIADLGTFVTKVFRNVNMVVTVVFKINDSN
jgi:hypothetical protein